MAKPELHLDLATRFRGYLPVVIDIETGGFNSTTDALLEIAAVTVKMDSSGNFSSDKTVHAHVEPFSGANIEAEAIKFNGIDPNHPFRDAVSELEALQKIFKTVRQALKESRCKRAILVGHNAFFDLGFLNAAIERTNIKRNPFHPFSTFDTVTLCGLAYGQTVLARAAKAANMEWDQNEAHSALYDAEQTAILFCKILNIWNEHAPKLIQTIVMSNDK